MIRRIVIVVVVLGVGFWFYQHSKNTPAPKSLPSANAQAPQFTATTIDGKAIDSSQFKGKVVLVDFWATWCVPCEAEIPHLVEWQNQHGSEGLQVIGLSMDDSAGPVKPFVEKHKMTYPVAMADEKTIAAFGGILGLPVNFIIGRDGKILSKRVGVTDIAVLQQDVERALAAK